jgi:plasmid stabilization system protein ParE
VNVRFLTIAQQEVDDAFRWFEERTEGKGLEFLDELDRVVRLIRTFPFAALEIEPEIRRSLLPRFPYAVVYGVEDQTLVVIAVAHTHREPRYWIDREFNSRIENSSES